MTSITRLITLELWSTGVNNMRAFDMFAGFGGASHALNLAGIDHEIVGFSEINRHASKCYSLNFPEIKNYGNATKINTEELPDFDILTAGFPCQPFSVSGKCLGEQDVRGTLFREVLRITESKKPAYVLLENVKGLISKRHSKTFQTIQAELKRIGYKIYWKVLNSKDYGIPQSRERVWIVGIRNDLNKEFVWPDPEPLTLKLKDLLESEVEEKYFLRPRQQEMLIQNIISKGKFNTNPSGRGLNGNVNLNDIAYTITTNKGEGQKILLPDVAWCIDANYYKGAGVSNYCEKKRRQLVLIGQRVRKLTPKECFRLLGFLNDQIRLDGLSNTQRYILAGNGWDINLVSKILKNMVIQ